MIRKRVRTRRPSAIKGDLPGQYLKRALVTVRSLALEQGGEFEEHHYIVRTQRFESEWTVEVEYRGEKYRLPHKVVQQITRHMDSIRKAQQHDRAIERSEQMRIAG